MMLKVGLIIVLSASCAVLIYLYFKNNARSKRIEGTLRSQLLNAESAAESSSQLVRSLESQIDKLSKWQQVADADAAVKSMIEAAEETCSILKAQAESLMRTSSAEATETLEKARTEADALMSNARNSSLQSMQSAKLQLSSATLEAKKIIDDAHQRAEQIAGDAYKAMQDAEKYEQTISAIKNLIEGYGNRYIVPNQSLLDGLAEAYSHEMAGDQLKQSRERSRTMVREGIAASCDYVEENRKVTAINFVTDAFDGKVDSILSRARHDNFGKLQQEIRDAFAIVNHLGRAFRNARIREEYLSSRLEELKFAILANELKIQEQEEQRKIREELREEEKARREIEKAIKDAAKEEEMLKRAVSKAQVEVERASAEQKERYELELAQLTERLRSAEEKNQRALSMAQQTKRGHVYIISNIGSFGDDIFKIGLTRRLEPLDRIRELGDSSVPFDFDVHALIFSEDAPSLEHKLHQHFLLSQVNKVNYRKEFFRASIEAIRREIERIGLECKWTMTAAAREYRESLAIDKMISENPDHRDAWMRRQLVLQEAEEREEFLQTRIAEKDAT